MLSRLPAVFKFLNDHVVRYVVIGGIAAIVHGVPRTTFDVDLLIDATPDDAKRLLGALLAAGIGSASLTSPEDLLAHEITIFKDVIRIDVQTHTPGVSFADAWTRREERDIDGVRYWILSRADLIATKRAAGRDLEDPGDLEDLRILDQDEPI